MPLRMLMLATDAHGGFGGIAQYNRDVLDAFSALDQVARVVVVPRLLASRDAAASDLGGIAIHNPRQDCQHAPNPRGNSRHRTSRS